ncbi:dihydrolipoamide dehydrogenase [Thermogladius calderae 1633]|uniref:Dihydrolipoyl dehydrogenase n=1 Tax=Thermogladius calderae (strain DSM 22663 / VKM B-2946 / 1633) TaxID=1184251 RepID=I3TEP2_THEC1|nr:dihydrolipoyl dehydrogenase [Thermogladius calderae]AFK51230.1 dihydrolipoamide dehydrogenase [Thermogladius calderae 1633]
MKHDVVVVGSGVAGYPAAIMLARRGLKVAVVEEHYLGGECTNYGCVPSKAFYHIAEAARTVKKVGGSAELSWESIVEWSNSMVEAARQGIEYLFESYGVKVYNGKGVIKENKRVRVKNGENVEIETEKVLLALGTDPRPLPGLEFDGKLIVSNREIFQMRERPGSLAIVGGGVIGVEVANAFVNLGVEVTVVERSNQILSFLDSDVAQAVKGHLRRRGVNVLEGVEVAGVERGESGVRLKLSDGKEIAVDEVLVAVGRVPKTSGVNLENVGVELDNAGFIKVSPRLETSVPSIYAAGDVVGGPLLAHKAMVESMIASKNITGMEAHNIDYRLVPLTIFTGLEVAYVGYTEKELTKLGIKYVRYKVPLNFLSAVKIKDGSYSFIKILVSEDSSKVYGVHIVAPNASEVISAFIPVVIGKMMFEDVSQLPYPHLTVGEALREIALLMLGEPVHILVRK